MGNGGTSLVSDQTLTFAQVVNFWYTFLVTVRWKVMPTVKKRIQVPVADRVHEELKRLAKKRGLSISSLAHTLLEEALEIQEDVYFSRIADAAFEEMERDNLVSHEEAWS